MTAPMILCNGCSKPFEFLTKAGYCGECNDRNNQTPARGHKPWTRQRLAEYYCSKHKDDIMWDRETKSYWKHDGKVWVTYDMEEDMATDIMQEIESVEKNKEFGNATLIDIAGLCRRTKGIKKVYRVEDDWISFNDTCLNTETWETAPHSPDRIATIHVDYDYATLSEAKCPIFDSFLADTCLDADGKVYNKGLETQIYEAFGYSLTNVKAEKCIIFYGGGMNGKSVALEIIRTMLGEERCGAATIEQLTKQGFFIDGIIGKRANLVDEQQGMAESADTLKRLVSGNPITTRRLYSKSMTFRPQTKFYFCSNNLPRFNEFDHAIRRRFLIMLFEHRLDEKKKNINIVKDMVANGEMPAIVYRALNALKELQSRRYVFTETEQSIKTMNSFEDASSSVSAYINEIGWVKSEDAKDKMPFYDIYRLYCDWCEKTGRKGVSSIRFTSDAEEKIGKTKRFKINGKLVNCYLIALRTEPETEEEEEASDDPIAREFGGKVMD